jgi:alpha-L-fucosidase
MRRLLYTLVIISFFSLRISAQPDPVKLQQWKDLKYSLFIHYGIYSVLGGVWEGKPVSKGLSEQIQAHAGIYSDTYAAVAKQFNPIYWNADSVALLAKASGMRSVVITSKHHDGFCMFRSAYTDFNVVDATPFKRDIVKELSDACKRHGLKFGLYFSLIDWHYPQASPISSHNSDYITPEHHEYNKKQVTELLSNYGTISELWFDMGSQSDRQSKELSDLVHGLQPDCLVSSRIGNDRGDFAVMGDNQEPDYSIGVPWQSPASFFDETWGYRSWQQRGSEEEKVREKLASLIRVASRGGNFLLNIGPKGDGSIVGFEKDVLLTIGKWLNKNGEAIYGTQPDPFQVAFDWGSVTASKNKIYLHLLANPKDGKIFLPGLKGKIKKAYLLSDNAEGKFSMNTSGVTVHLPKGVDVTNEFKVVVIEFEKGYTTTPVHVVKELDHRILLNTSNAFKYYSSSCIDYNTRFRSTVKELWTITPQNNNRYVPALYYTDEEKGKDIDLSIDNKEQVVHLDGDKVVNLKNEPSAIHWGTVYKTGPFWSGLEGANGNVTDIDVNKPWTTDANSSWQIQPDWQNGKIYSMSAGPESAYYLLQEISSSGEQPLLIDVTGGDGVVVFVNGKEQLIHLNSNREEAAKDVILIHLKDGKNQLLVKFFNNFRKEINYSIGSHLRQIIYEKKLNPVKLESGKRYTVSWKLHNPVTPHQALLLPNLSLEIKE